MLHDIDAARQNGLAGIVIGASRPDHRLDGDLLARLIAHAQPLKVSLHRVFDLVEDPFQALEQAIELKFERILTSGGATQAHLALPLLARLHAKAAGRIAIMPGSGIDASNVAAIIASTGVGDIHASCREVIAPLHPKNLAQSLALGFSPAHPMRTSAAKIRTLRTASNFAFSRHDA